MPTLSWKHFFAFCGVCCCSPRYVTAAEINLHFPVSYEICNHYEKNNQNKITQSFIALLLVSAILSPIEWFTSSCMTRFWDPYVRFGWLIEAIMLSKSTHKQWTNMRRRILEALYYLHCIVQSVNPLFVWCYRFIGNEQSTGRQPTRHGCHMIAYLISLLSLICIPLSEYRMISIQ